MTEDEGAIDRWFLEYVKPHFLKVLDQKVKEAGMELKHGDEVQLGFCPDDPGILVPAFVVEKLLEDEDF